MSAETRVAAYDVTASVAVLTMSNAPANTYSYATIRERDEGILRAGMDPSVHATVLPGAGERFLGAGADTEMLDVKRKARFTGA